MKKITVFLALVLLVKATTIAKPIPLSQAQIVAENYYKAQYPGKNYDLSLAYTETDANGTPVYYIFNLNDKKGFVVVTADDAAYPIIGSSDEGAFVMPTSPNNVSFWLQERKKEIIAIRTHHIAATSDIKDKWTSYNSNEKHPNHNITSGVLPLCSTTWDQSPYYNAMCPGGSPTGCVATAMAQIIRYWEYPNVGFSSHCYEDEVSQGFQENYGDLCAEFDTSHYDWSAMPISVTSPNKEVAKLMYDCGVGIDMDYGPYGSGAGPEGVLTAFPDYFGYDTTTIKEALYHNYTVTQWISLLENELNNRRVMLYGGEDNSSGAGHAWVCDGYTVGSDTLFHMNWGWSGSANGYYSVTHLNPNNYSVDFNSGLTIIYGIQPPQRALSVNQITDNTETTVYPNPSSGIFNFGIPNNGDYQIRIYNLLGQLVNASIINSRNNRINISSQPQGIYLYRLLNVNGDLVSEGKLVKNI